MPPLDPAAQKTLMSLTALFKRGMERKHVIKLTVAAAGLAVSLSATLAVVSLTQGEALPVPPLGRPLSTPLTAKVHAMALSAAENPMAPETTQNLQEAMDLNDRVLQQSPLQTQAWVMQAWLASMRDGYFSDETRHALTESYARVRIDPDAGLDRTVLILNAWNQAGPVLQSAALYELEGLYRAGRARPLRNAQARITDPLGSVALSALLDFLDAEAKAKSER